MKKPSDIESAPWRNDRFRASWTARIEGEDFGFQIIDAQEQAEGLLLGKYDDGRFAVGFDVNMLRVDEP